MHTEKGTWIAEAEIAMGAMLLRSIRPASHLHIEWNE